MLDQNKVITVFKMPETPQDILKLLEELQGEYYAECWIENVGGSRPGNSAQSAKTFAKHVGHLEMALLALQIPTQRVMPTKWMNFLCPSRTKGTESDEVAKRKVEIYEALQRLYPQVSFAKYQADALGILHYALNNK